MVSAYLNILTQSIALTNSMFIFGNYFFAKNAITFDLTEIERKNIFRCHKVLLAIQWCHQKCQYHKKETTLKNCQQNQHFPKKNRYKNNNEYFRILEVLLVILTTYLPV